jgi:acyl-CoA thioesterase FadM
MSNLPSAITGAPGTALTPAQTPGAPVAYQPAGAQAPDEGAGAGPLIQRTLAALNRFKWLALATTALGAIGGLVASRFVTPSYNVVSTLLITAQQANQAGGPDRGPIRQEQILYAQGWLDLLKSYSIADSVVMKLALYIEPEKAADTVAFRRFEINRTAFRPGNYTLAVDGPRYTLRDKLGIVNETGIAGDSIGLVVETGCTYFAPLSFPGDVEVGIAIDRLGESSVTYRLGIFAAGAQDPAAQGHFTHVYVSRATRRPVELPDQWRASLAKLQ